MKSPRTSLLVASAFAFALTSASASAQKKDEVDCSPGFWKNHQSIWIPASCLELNCPLLQQLLYVTGPKSGVFKNLAGDMINGWATENEITANCD